VSCGPVYSTEGHAVLFCEPWARRDKLKEKPIRANQLRREQVDWFEGRVPAEGVILDLGSGQARYRHLFGDRLVMLDVNLNPVTDIVSNLESPIPVRSSAVRAVLMNNLLEHLYKPDFAIAESYRVLEPGGTLLMTTPFLVKIHNPPHDYLRYTEHWLRRFCQDTGFRSVEVTPFGGLRETLELTRWARLSRLLKMHTGARWATIRLALLVQNAAQKIIDCLAVDDPGPDPYPLGYGVIAVK
jgi:SAM-dependent methyltransferase